MYKCEYCGKEYKMEYHLNNHVSSCKERPTEEDIVKDDTLVVKEEIVPSSVSTASGNTIPDNQASIEKLKAQISRCRDAETKFRLECELKRLL